MDLKLEEGSVIRRAITITASLLTLVLATLAWRTGSLAAEVTPDAAVERFLRAAEVVDTREIGTGVTRPLRVTLELDGEARTAAFKSVDIYEPGITRFESEVVMHFRDRYHSEVAAYLLDRELGLNMVPVAVLRSVRGKEGALVDWIEDTYSTAEAKGLFGEGVEGPVEMVAQRKVMWLFDALIYNTDRHLSNGLVTKSDSRLHLIDHSRAFRPEKTLHGPFATQRPSSLPRALHARLRDLEEKSLRKTMKGLLTRAQLRALMVRRDRILDRIEQDRRDFGDELVFQD